MKVFNEFICHLIYGTIHKEMHSISMGPFG